MNYNYRTKAFSIIEITIAIAILMFLLLPVFTMMTRGSKGTILNRNEILAQQYASNYIAYCNLQRFDSELIKETTEEKNVDKLDIEKGGSKFAEIDKLEEGFKRFVTIKDFPDSDEIPYKYKVITVRVEWQQSGEKSKRKVTMSGLVTEG